jgi:hypothetical protein
MAVLGRVICFGRVIQRPCRVPMFPMGIRLLHGFDAILIHVDQFVRAHC